jgi:hypothetical protein
MCTLPDELGECSWQSDNPEEWMVRIPNENEKTVDPGGRVSTVEEVERSTKPTFVGKEELATQQCEQHTEDVRCAQQHHQLAAGVFPPSEALHSPREGGKSSGAASCDHDVFMQSRLCCREDAEVGSMVLIGQRADPVFGSERTSASAMQA